MKQKRRRDALFVGKQLIYQSPHRDDMQHKMMDVAVQYLFSKQDLYSTFYCGDHIEKLFRKITEPKLFLL